ncbi:MAG: hypothetical protein ABR922_06895 [Streptosporangiaceae bacterium]
MASVSSREALASAEKAWNSSCRSERPACASSPATATTSWQRPSSRGSDRYLAATRRADCKASSLPPPISSARESTAIALRPLDLATPY